MSIRAKVFKIETFGAVDGPSIRLVIFMQGCNFRCKYCHNPESWSLGDKKTKKLSVRKVISLYKKNKSFYDKGGITLSGGEPMLQPDFIKALAIKCKRKKIHLAIDTSACNFETNKQAYLDLINLVDLWIVDVKAIDKNEHKFITGSDQTSGINFIKFLEENNKPYWLRQVIVKSINDDSKHLDQLANFIRTLKCCQKYELLSYHNLAINKYKDLNIDYPLKNIQTFKTEEFNEIKNNLSKKLKH